MSNKFAGEISAQTQVLCEVLDCTIISDLNDETNQACYAIGTNGELSAGIRPRTHTKWFDSLLDLNRFIAENPEEVEKILIDAEFSEKEIAAILVSLYKE